MRGGRVAIFYGTGVQASVNFSLIQDDLSGHHSDKLKHELRGRTRLGRIVCGEIDRARGNP
jgi:hypothetical protein